jgi:DNA primase
MSFAQQLKSQIDIVRVVSDYVRLKKVGGSSRWVGLCPFHSEKTPSFGVNAAQQFYKCFGCGAGGDVFKFVMEVEGLTFWETLKLLAERHGIPLPHRSEHADEETRLRAALFEMHEIAARVFEEGLRGPEGGIARAYLQKRGLTPELIATFQLGYSDASGQALVRRFESRFTREQLEASGLVKQRESGGYYDVFRGRLMFPIHNESGKVIGFGGRALRDGDEPKYLNSPQTPIYHKTSVLYNLHRAKEGMRRNQRAVLVEGYMDVIGVYAAGVQEVVATCGTALTNQQVRSIHRHADTVIVNFDPDQAGANAAEKAISLLLEESLRVHVVTLDGGLDPDEYVKTHGADRYQQMLGTATSYFHWLADRARQRFDLRSAEGRVDAFKFLLPSLLKVPDKIERAAIADEIAEVLRLDKSLVREQFRKAAGGGRVRRQEAYPGEIPDVEKLLLRALVSSQLVRHSVLPALEDSGLLAGFTTRKIFEALIHAAGEPAGFDFAVLEIQLSEPDKILLHQTLSADGEEQESVLLDQAQACLRKLELAQRKNEIEEIRRQVQLAEREGRPEEALRLSSELEERQRQMRKSAASG